MVVTNSTVKLLPDVHDVSLKIPKKHMTNYMLPCILIGNSHSLCAVELEGVSCSKCDGDVPGDTQDNLRSQMKKTHSQYYKL